MYRICHIQVRTYCDVLLGNTHHDTYATIGLRVLLPVATISANEIAHWEQRSWLPSNDTFATIWEETVFCTVCPKPISPP
jgi:hypothetical protein